MDIKHLLGLAMVVVYGVVFGAILYVALEPGVLSGRDPDGRPIELHGFEAFALALMYAATWPGWGMIGLILLISRRRR